VHVLVARAFCKKLENDRVVNHIDGNKQNNKSSNLEWCTHSHNSQHAVDTGLTPKDRSSKLKKAVLQILPDGTTCEFDSLASAERATGVSRASIRTVCRGEHIKAECAGGFGWEYIEIQPPAIEDAQNIAATDLKSAPCGGGSVIQTLPNGIARRFASVFDAERETGTPRDEIEEACRGEGTTTGWAHVTIVFDDDPIWAILEAELQG
jgi:hypothetical protein